MGFFENRSVAEIRGGEDGSNICGKTLAVVESGIADGRDGE